MDGMEVYTDGQTNRWMNGMEVFRWTNEQMDGMEVHTDGQTDRRMDGMEVYTDGQTNR